VLSYPSVIAARSILRAFGDPAVDLAAYVADVAAITGETALAVVRSAGRLRPVVREVLWRQIYFGAVRAAPFTLLLALLVAFAVAAQSPYSAAAGGDVLGTVLVATLVRELAPLLAAWIVIARSGTAIAAELAAMRIEGEVDALLGMGIDPFEYLVVPRVVGTAAAVASLTAIFLAFALGASALLSPLLGGPSPRILLDHVAGALRPADAVALAAKVVVPGMAIAAVACHEGLAATRSTTRIPPAVTAAGVRAFTLVFVWNTLVTALLYLS
jgi:phospholipid/cholesterol/gamma-HCH transport system permease protein